jgi:hypothetical protein
LSTTTRWGELQAKGGKSNSGLNRIVGANHAKLRRELLMKGIPDGKSHVKN